MSAQDFTPHPSVHRPYMFICDIDDPDAVVVAYNENPAARIASDLLDELGEWHHALHNLQRESVPAGVLAALDELHDAVCGWVEWNEQQAKHLPPDNGPRPTPPRPAPAA
ncbi:hypothetical protein ACIP9H_33415 [Streptomyces sp. NPDC088732]|uniref:hypothetical protein n=1 Tax=Streptomyces sp. NPDC088732 TaxID=3365879 RepID=UPI003809C869